MDEDFRKRLRKTFYCGDLEPDAASLSLTDLSVEYFQSLAPHKLGYIDLHSASNVTSHETVSTSSVAMGMIYAKRLQKKRPEYVKKMSSSDLFLISMMMASKYLYDEGVDEEVFNDEWAENADLEKEEINHMEMEFLDAMDWELFIKRDEFDHLMLSIERSIALREGLRRGWFSYTDLCILWGDPRIKYTVTDVGLEWLKIAVVSSAAYFAAAMTMVGSAVLVTNASLVLASSGLLPVLLPGLQPSGIPLVIPLPEYQSVPPRPAVDLPSAIMYPGGSTHKLPNETAETEAAEELGSDSPMSDSSWAPGKTVVETIMSQLMAVLTLKSHLAQFVSAVADNYTTIRARSNTKNWHDAQTRCATNTDMRATHGENKNELSTADVFSRWMDLEKRFGALGQNGNALETCCCCGKLLSPSQTGFRSPRSVLPEPRTDAQTGGHCEHDSWRKYYAGRGANSPQPNINPSWPMNGPAWVDAGPRNPDLGHCCQPQSNFLPQATRCGDEVAGVGCLHSFPDITIGFTTSMLPPPAHAT